MLVRKPKGDREVAFYPLWFEKFNFECSCNFNLLILYVYVYIYMFVCFLFGVLLAVHSDPTDKNPSNEMFGFFLSQH